jgi:hypothetical protein
MKTALSTLTSCAVSAILMGCASTPAATDNIARARTLVDQAARGSAQRCAAADLGRARDGLQKAAAADREGEPELAARLADEAAADAELALARAESAEAARAAEEVQRSVEVLRRETERKAALPAPVTGS